MDLKTAFDRAGIVTHAVEIDGVLNIGYSNTEGHEWSVDVLPA